MSETNGKLNLGCVTIGSRVKITVFDGEEGFPYETNGRVSFDWEEINYTPKVDVTLDNGNIVSMVYKSSLTLISQAMNGNVKYMKRKICTFEKQQLKYSTKDIKDAWVLQGG